MTPDEVEVGRRNLIAELQDGKADGMDVSADMVRDLIAVLEASKPAVVDREADGLREKVCDLRAWCEMQREASGLEETEFAAGEFLAYKRVVVHLRKILTAPTEAAALYPKATEGESCPASP